MGRNRRYKSDAERQRAYRERLRDDEKQMYEELRALRGGAVAKDAFKKKLARILGMLGSANPNERDNAAIAAARMVKEAGLTWYSVLNVTDDK